MKFWGVSQKKNWGVRLINFMAFWGREGGGGVPKCLKIFSWKMMGTVSKNLK